ncbi:LytTR family DNA-binding domain-containing protein [Flavobacterium sp. NRK F10]|uniref:LytR/AlgR family response regulator transcription factor n=1 Tax=Flavobacterium sp. NRK F10 TaxID=2954931 RepID=UPI0020913CB6|nr:LytTR family DNA-binding domain-containing protein [Flavobacterium sp. NRK F10]MCO6173681.1 LytTR family DNA-binding domain-containing protein [Flavobacterium sp. NRK F10]
METIKAIIIEDENRAQIYLKGVLEMIAPEVEIVSVCDDLPSGVIAIRKYKPDLVFLDIEMPKYNGLEIVNFFDENEMNFAIIFTTAYNQYAIQAFKTSAIDYLLKPIDPNELKAAIDRFSKKHTNPFREIIQVTEQLKKETKIAIPDGNSLIMVAPSEILYLKADNSYTQIVLLSGKKMVTSRFLKNFEESLKEHSPFFRCHKSYIINTEYIVSYSKSDGGTVTLQNQIEIPVSGDKVEELLALFIRVIR